MRRSSATHTARIYTQQLLFKLAFGDKADPPNYVGFQRGAVELHMQFQFEHEMETIRLRFLVEDPDALFSEYRQRGVECNPNNVHDTSWGTREFALYDFDRNALTFYRDLQVRGGRADAEQASHREEVHMASMKKEEARRAVLSEYDRWAKKHPNDASMMGGFLFFRYLQKERSDLLDFRSVGDKWQIVHGWLRDRLED